MLDELAWYIAIFIASLFAIAAWIGRFGNNTIQVVVTDPEDDETEFVITIPRIGELP